VTGGPVDLHLHSNHSDGADAPADVVARARALGLSAIALTDHDTHGGIPEAQGAAQDAGIDFLPGVEISCSLHGREIHVLAYGPGAGCEALDGLLARIRAGRRERIAAILDRLRAAGIPVDLEMGEGGEDDSPGRMHVARRLREMGITKSTQEGFDRFLNLGRVAYVPKTLAPVAEAIDTIHAAGGLASLAHPGLGKGLRKLMPALCALPFDAIEAYHISHSPGETERFLELARERGWLVTGGSDCHGGIKGTIEMGKVLTPRACFDRLQDRLAGRA
jgi:predicted metal-dependent phosphoesterase TrpH